MQTSFFTEFAKRPTLRLQLELEEVISKFSGGLHRSIISGAGLEFKRLRPYDPADSPTVIDDVASARHSEDSELEPLSREYYSERPISVIFLLDVNDAMGRPSKKYECAAGLFWLFALSAFEPHDPFRILCFREREIVDSDFLANEEAVEEWLASWSMGRGPRREPLRGGNIFVHLASWSLQDAIVILVSDFSRDWSGELRSLRQLGVHDNNICVIFFALDEWMDCVPSGYGASLRDSRTGAVRHYTDEELVELRAAHEEHLKRIRLNLRPLGVPLVNIPLLSNPVALIQRKFLQMGYA